MVQPTPCRACVSRLIRCVVAVVSFAVGAHAGWAAAADGGDVPQASNLSTSALASMPLESLMQVKFVTTASLFKQRVADAPAAAVVLTADDIRNFGWRTLADALASLPGLYTSYDRTYTYLGARGFRRPGDYNSRFLLLIDGMRVNDAVYDQAAIGTDFPLDLDLVERIEYVPGPGSAVYGSNALFGVINVVTKSGRDFNGAQVATSAGSFGERRARATYGWHGDNGADLVLSATSYARSGQDLYYPEFDTPEQNHGVANGLDYDRAQYLFAKLAYRGLTISAGYGNRTKGAPNAPYDAVFNAPFSTTDTHSFVNASYRHAVSSELELAAQVFWERYDYRSRAFYGDPAALNVDGDKAIWYGADLHATWTGLRGHKIVAGVNATRDASRTQYNYNVDPYEQILDDHHSANRIGIYVEDEIQLSRRFTFNAGLRLDDESISGVNLSPRLALIYKATDRDTVKLVYGQAYRAPNAYELYYTIPGADGQQGNASLKPEHITTVELIYDRQLGEAGHATASIFHYHVRNLISEMPNASGVEQFQNVNRANAKGVELAYEQRIAGGATVRASYTWQMTRDEDSGLILQDSPRHLAKLNVAVPLFGQAARLGTELRCVSSRLAQGGAAGGYCLGNVTIGTARLIPHGDLSFSVYNVTDKRYSDPAGPGFAQSAIVQQSRTFLAKLVVGF
ncbi:iron complex outermembrane recepter protein [Trinickia caryophylli]|uniref:Iron complex outermembrane recepter protein n=1 Tax=Trinickia caryophylli TaxID=28094 RepID=A0A1X7CPX9_TRICW|nr:iron complex outermembrane recepter protein [Trinickia caryophylli]